MDTSSHHDASRTSGGDGEVRPSQQQGKDGAPSRPEAVDPIVLWPNKRLMEPARRVENFGYELKALVDRMRRAMEHNNGIGISANQIGEPWAVAIVAPRDIEEFVLVNPELLAPEREADSGFVALHRMEEGCLSLPGEIHRVERVARARVRFQNVLGAWQTVDWGMPYAHIVQHEVGHIRGEVFADLLGPVARGGIRERMLKRIRWREKHARRTPAGAR